MAPGVPDSCIAAVAQGAFTSGSLGSVHPGAPTAPLTCEEEEALLQEAQHTRRNAAVAPKRCAFKPSFGDLMPRKVAVFKSQKNPHDRIEHAHVAFQLLRKLIRIAVPHFCNTFCF